MKISYCRLGIARRRWMGWGMDGSMDTVRKEGPKTERVLDGSENGSGTPLDVLGGTAGFIGQEKKD